jgi:predicted nucleic acid-binding Zn ribbon protein
MSTPTAGVTRPAPEHTHPCVRCGAQVPLDVSMCERCNPLGLQQPATSQVHGTVFVALVVALVVLAVAGRAALSGVGPFQGRVIEVLPVASGLAVTLEVQNDGTKTGATTCRITRTANRGVGASAIVQSPQVGAGERLSFTTTTDLLGTDAAPLSVECQNP